MSDLIIIDELEVCFRVGVPDEERETPQRLLVSIHMSVDTRAAAAVDDLRETVDYYEVTEQIKALGDGCAWKLIESLAADVAALVLKRSMISAVVVEISKFILPDTKRVAVRVHRSQKCEE